MFRFCLKDTRTKSLINYTFFLSPGVPIQLDYFLAYAFPPPVHRGLRVSSRLTPERRCPTLHDPFGAGDS